MTALMNSFKENVVHFDAVQPFGIIARLPLGSLSPGTRVTEREVGS